MSLRNLVETFSSWMVSEYIHGQKWLHKCFKFLSTVNADPLIDLIVSFTAKILTIVSIVFALNKVFGLSFTYEITYLVLQKNLSLILAIFF